jgi:hypothetical protein
LRSRRHMEFVAGSCSALVFLPHAPNRDGSASTPHPPRRVSSRRLLSPTLCVRAAHHLADAFHLGLDHGFRSWSGPPLRPTFQLVTRATRGRGSSRRVLCDATVSATAGLLPWRARDFASSYRSSGAAEAIGAAASELALGGWSRAWPAN